MWHWDQGRLHYFQYDELRTVARFAAHHDLRNSPPDFIRSQTGLTFLPVAENYTPWRNYARVYKLCMMVCEIDNRAVPTDVARILALDGVVTCDEYIHFLVEATTSPSPALAEWSNKSALRHPLCFALKYILAKIAVYQNPVSSINEIIGAYVGSGFGGGEDVSAFVELLDSGTDYEELVTPYQNTDPLRQSRESIKFLCQLSYLHTYGSRVVATLSAGDASSIFEAIAPLGGPPLADGNEEILRRASHFKDGSVHDFFDYPSTTASEVSLSGFAEGSRVQRSHMVIERNAGLRDLFYSTRPTAVCHACEIDTHAKYPWTERVLDLHHILPLSSGTRVHSQTGTLLDDLVPICPTCHRSVHSYYECYLHSSAKADFSDKEEAAAVYEKARNAIVRS